MSKVPLIGTTEAITVDSVGKFEDPFEGVTIWIEELPVCAVVVVAFKCSGTGVTKTVEVSFKGKDELEIMVLDVVLPYGAVVESEELLTVASE